MTALETTGRPMEPPLDEGTAACVLRVETRLRAATPPVGSA